MRTRIIIESIPHEVCKGMINVYAPQRTVAI